VRVQLLYQPTKPDLGRVNTFWRMHGLPLLLGLFGGILFFVGLSALTGAVRVR